MVSVDALREAGAKHRPGKVASHRIPERSGLPAGQLRIRIHGPWRRYRAEVLLRRRLE